MSRTLQAVLLHVEKDDADAVPQPTSAQRFGQTCQHDHARCVVDHAVAVTAALERNGIEMCADDNLRTLRPGIVQNHVLTLFAWIALT